MEVLGQAQLRYDRQADIGGDGQNSKVYRCFDHHLRATLVVKEIEKSKLDPAKFFLEAQAVYASAHPRVVPVHWAAETDEKVCIAMPLMPNGSLADAIRKGPLKASRVIAIGQDICEGVAQIHIARFVHLDIKPTNVLFDVNGRASVGDFGLAAELDHADTADTRDLHLYSPAHPPELHKQKGVLTPAADVYQLGLTLYRAANGEPYHRRQWERLRAKSLQEKRDAVANGTFPDRTFLPSVPQRLRQIIRRALDVDPQKRQVGARALAEDLAQVEVHHDWETEAYTDEIASWRLRSADRVDLVVLRRGLLPDTATEIWTDREGARRRKKPDAWESGLRTDKQVLKALAKAFRAAET